MRKRKDTRPGSVRIFGRPFTIRWVAKVDDEDSMGQTLKSDHTIDIKEGQPPFEAADTLLHEVIHGLEHVMGFTVPERTIVKLTSGILGVLHDNPEVAKWLLSSQPPTPKEPD